MQWFLSWVTLSISICALFVALRTLALYHSERPSALSTRLAEIEDLTEKQSLALRNLRSRLNMQDSRSRKAPISPEPDDIDDPDAARAEWRRKINAQLASGQLSALPKR